MNTIKRCKCADRIWPLLLAIIFAAGTIRLTAAPIFGGVRTFMQPDGTEVPLVLNGDEFYLRAETPDGYTVVRDPKTDWICYAQLSPDGTGFVSTGVPYRGTNSAAGSVEQRALLSRLTLTPHLDLSPANRIRQAKLAKTTLLGSHTELVEGTRPSPNGATPAGGRSIKANDAASLPPRKSNLEKYNNVTIRGVVLVIDFSDAPAGSSPTFQDYVDSINKPNFHKSDGRANSLRTFYEDVSHGSFIVSNYVYGIYRAPNTFAYYDSLSYGTGAQLLMGEALQQLQASGFDFSQLSVDANHEVLDLCVMYTGSPKTWAQGMWFHSGWWGSGPTYNGVTFRRYCTTSASTDPGTIIHEHGHLIADWPDIYSYNGVPTGTWDIMGGGWTDLPNPYLLYENGWINAVNVFGSYGFRAMNSLDLYNVLVYYDAAQPNEFYFIRPYTKNLKYCPGIPDEGLALWRINLQGDNAQYPNTPLLCELVHANGVIANDSANVLFKAAGRNRYTDTTTPGSYWVYDAHKGQRSGMNLTGISAPANAMTFRVSRPIYFYPIPTQVSSLGVATNLKVTAVSDLPVTYSATSLPAGMNINSGTGLISGTPNTAGGYNVTLTATAGDGSQNTCEFAWLVDAGATTAPVAWYPFTAGSYGDFSGNGRAASPIGSPTFVNNTVSLNGSNNAVSIPRSIANDFTIAFFMKASASGLTGSQWYNGSGLVDGEVAGAANDFGVTLTGDQIAFGIGSTGGDKTIQSLRKVTDGQWHHVAVTRSATSGAMAIYIDGTLDVTGTGTTGAKTAPPVLRLGSLQTAIHYFNGALDEVRLYGAAISAAEIYRLSRSRVVLAPIADQVSYLGDAINLKVTAAGASGLTYSATGLPTGLSIQPSTGNISGTAGMPGVYDVTIKTTSAQGPESSSCFTWAVCLNTVSTAPLAWYPLESNVQDISGYNRNGVVLGAPIFVYPGMRFNGVNDAVRIPRPISGDFTISFFMQASASGGSGSQWWSGDGLVDGEVSGAANDFGVSLTGDQIAFGVGSTSGDTTIQSVKTVTDRAWHHVTVTRNVSSGAIAIYIDGRLDVTGTASTGQKTAPPTLRIGSLQTGINYFKGGLDDVKIYGSVLSAEEIFRQSQMLPANPGYAVSLTSLPPSSGQLTWGATPGEVYQIEWTPDLEQGFAPFDSPVSASDVFRLTRSITSPAGNGFYRIRKL